MRLKQPYLLFLGDAPDRLAAKTAIGVADWRPELCVGQFRMSGCQADLGLADLSLEQAVEKGAKTLVIGVANRGGVISPEWADVLNQAVKAGLDIASGLHSRLKAVTGLQEMAEQMGRTLIDVRHHEETLPVGSGEPRSGLRLLTVGTDCSVGKMYTSLAIERELKKRNIPADFRATGQTGIFIAGEGISVDAVVADFIAGAAEILSPANEDDHWDVVEGQGSLFHPSYAGVSMGLLHGSQPDALVLCHDPSRKHMRGIPHLVLPSLQECIEANLSAARLTNGHAKVVGVSLNTKELSEEEALELIHRTAERTGLPCVDPVRTGVAAIVNHMLDDK